jgi:hypothetical protein
MVQGCSLRYEPLLGTGPSDPVCGLLEVEGVVLLLNCGCTEQFDEAQLAPLLQ